MDNTDREREGKPTLTVWKPVKKQRQRMPKLIKDLEMARDETEDLNLHVKLCSERYQNLENKIHAVESRITKIESAVADIKTQTQTGFTDIKLLLERQNTSKQIQVVATFGTIITAVLAFIGYLIVK